MNKRALALFLCLIMIFALLPAASLADGETMKIGTVYLSKGKYLASNGTAEQSSPPDSGGYAYRQDDTTLVLNDFRYDIGSGVYIFAQTEGNYTLKLIGTNTVSATDALSALYVSGNITISQESTGSLVATASTNAIDVSGSLSVNGGFLKGVTNGSKSVGFLYGVHVVKGSITVSGGQLEGVYSGIQANNSFGVYTQYGSITVKNNGSITGYGGTAITHSYGVQSGLETNGLSPNAGIIADGGSITGYGGAADEYSYGVYSSGNITAKGGGSITGSGAKAKASYGVRTQKGITADGGSITGTGGTIENNSSSCGVYAGVEYGENADKVITVKNNGTITGTGHNLSDPDKKPSDSIGVYAAYNIIADSGNIYGNGTKAERSFGVQAGNNIVATGGNITGDSKDGVYSYGVIANSSITVTGGSVTGSGSGDYSCGMSGSDSVTVSGGTVLAKGGTAALNKVDYSSYAPPYTLKASKSVTGSPTVEFDDALLADYKYFRIGPPSAPDPSGGGSNTPSPVTVYNDPSVPNATVWLTGTDLDVSDLLIIERDPKGSEYRTLKKLADSDDVFATYNVYLRSGRKSTGVPMHLTFDLNAKYAGEQFTLVHQKADGTYEYFYATADASGDLTFGPLYELSPFMLVKGTLSSDIISVPNTGDTAQSALWTGFELISLLVLGAAALFIKRKSA